MERVATGHVEPDHLLAYAQGQDDAAGQDAAAVAAHVAACAECAAEVSAYRLLDRVLRSRLFRVDCPDPQVLGDLALDVLAPEEALSMRQHLALCPPCTQELAGFQADLRGDPLADLVPRPSSLARLVARLLPAPGTGPALASVRGGDDARAETARTYEVDGLTLSLTVEAAGAGPARRWALLGLVIDEAGDGVATGLVVRLRRHGGVVATELDDLGNFTVTGLEAGVYDLELVRATDVIVVEGLEIGTAQAQA